MPLSYFFFSSRRRHTRSLCDWSSDVCSSDLVQVVKVHQSLENYLCDLANLIRSRDRKSTRLNSSHTVISYAVFCLKKKNINNRIQHPVVDAELLALTVRVHSGDTDVLTDSQA